MLTFIGSSWIFQVTLVEPVFVIARNIYCFGDPQLVSFGLACGFSDEGKMTVIDSVEDRKKDSICRVSNLG